MRERYRWGSEWVRERGRLLKREIEREGGSERERERRGEYENREKQMCQNCMPTMNVNTLWVVGYSSENFLTVE